MSTGGEKDGRVMCQTRGQTAGKEAGCGGGQGISGSAGEEERLRPFEEKQLPSEIRSTSPTVLRWSLGSAPVYHRAEAPPRYTTEFHVRNLVPGSASCVGSGDPIFQAFWSPRGLPFWLVKRVQAQVNWEAQLRYL